MYQSFFLAITLSLLAGVYACAGESPAATGEIENRLILKAGTSCYIASFNTQAGEIVSCTRPLPMRYTKRDCGDSSVQEIADTDAVVTCESNRRFSLRFRTSQDVVHFSMQLAREGKGKRGVGARYFVSQANIEESSLKSLLPEPRIVEISGKIPEESPLRFKLSGFAFVEAEKTRRFGYDVGTAQPNFDAFVKQPYQSNFNFFTNIATEVAKDKTSLNSVFEIGELFFGHTGSGGAMGGRANNVFEVRNLYLNHEFSDRISSQMGLLPSASDPRSFIYSDHTASLHALFKNDLAEFHL